MKTLTSKRREAFKDKDYRHGYIDEFLNARIATQIKVIREQRGWSQQKLAEEAGMKQPRISVMENVNYSSWSLNVLRKLAEAFDVTLNVSFEEFGTRAHDVDDFSRENLERRCFDDDPSFKEATENDQDDLELLDAQRQTNQGLGNLANVASIGEIESTVTKGLSGGRKNEIAFG